MLNKPKTAWPQKPLSELVDLNPRLDKSAYRDELDVSFVPMAAVEAGSGQIEVSQTKHFATVKRGYTPFREGDVLFAKITPCMENGKMAVVPKLTNDLGFGSTEFHVLRPHEGIHPRYVYYFVSSAGFRRDAAHQMTGAVGQKRVPQSFLEEASIPVPLFEEQKQIVAEIEKQFSRLDEAVASLKRTKANLKRYKAAVLKSAVEGKLTEDWRKQHPDVEPAGKLLERILAERRAKWKGRGKYKEPVASDTTDLPTLPKDWTWATFEQLSQRVTVGHVGPMKHEYVPKGVPFLRSQNVRENRFDPEGLLFIRPEFHKELSKSVIQVGDLAVVRSGSVGVTCVIPDGLGEANCADLVLVQRPLGLIPQFGAYYMNSLAKRRVEAGKVGVALTHFNTKSVAAMPVPLPSLAEQKQIVAEVERRLSVIDELEATVEANLTRADRLRQSILQQAFQGTLVTASGDSSSCLASAPPLAAETVSPYGKQP